MYTPNMEPEVDTGAYSQVSHGQVGHRGDPGDIGGTVHTISGIISVAFSLTFLVLFACFLIALGRERL